MSLKPGLIFPFLLSAQILAAQGINLPQYGMDYLHREQLAGRFDSTLSLNVNPNNTPYSLLTGHPAGRFEALPVTLFQQYNSEHPYGWNTGSMIPAKGYQSMVSFGLFARLSSHITLQIAPEIVYAANEPFETFGPDKDDRSWANRYIWYNTIDQPERFGDGSYTRVFAGQSSLRYNFKAFSAGISTENMWWGPGTYNSLIMSINAPGFFHLTFNTTRPVVTGIGSFEGQVIAGRLDGSDILPPDTGRLYNGSRLYQPKNDEWRFITGMVMSWQPKWVKGLFLGFSKVSYQYHSDITTPLDLLPLQGIFGEKLTASEKRGTKSSMGSFFARYFMPEENAEIYLEYGRSDEALFGYNFLQDPQYRMAYVGGLRKLFPLKNGSFIQAHLELTQTQAPTPALVNSPASWYTDQYVRQGYTQLGRVIGAGIGPGGNSQTLEVAWTTGLKKIGLSAERLVHNHDFFYYNYEIPHQDLRIHWVDLHIGANVNWPVGKLLLSAGLDYIHTMSYEWRIIIRQPYIDDRYWSNQNSYDNYPLKGRLSVSYRF